MGITLTLVHHLTFKLKTRSGLLIIFLLSILLPTQSLANIFAEHVVNNAHDLRLASLKKSTTQADATVKPDINSNKRSKKSTVNQSQLTLHKRSFIIWSQPDEDTDEPGLQVRLSAKYALLDCWISTQSNFLTQPMCKYLQYNSDKSPFSRFRMELSYTTDFDFYIISEGNRLLNRKSRPVRNRMTSPAFHLKWSKEEGVRSSGLELYNTTLSIVHHSNGQDIEPDTVFPEGSTDQEIIDAVALYEQNNPSWMDGVSRGWNYLELKLGARLGRSLGNCIQVISCIEINTGYKHPIFTEPENRIWWEPGNDAEYTDYNRFFFQLANEWDSNLTKRLSAEFHCGNRGCSANASFRGDLRIGGDNFVLPLMLYGHYGRNEHIYNYHEKANMIGLGFEFSQ